MGNDFQILVNKILVEGDIEFEVIPGIRSYRREVQEIIDREWQIATADKDRYLYDGRVYTLLHYQQDKEKLQCRIQETSYKALWGTNLRHCAELSTEDRADSIAFCCVVESSDSKILVGLRSKQLAESTEIWHIPGGNWEFINGTLAPLYSAMQRELREEFLIGQEQITTFICTGLGRNLLNQKPEFLFYCRLRVTAKECEALFSQAEDAEEHTQYRWLPVKEMGSFIQRHPFSPAGKAALNQYIEFKEEVTYG